MSAAVVLELCDGEHSLQEIIDIIQSAYDLDAPPLEDFKASVDESDQRRPDQAVPSIIVRTLSRELSLHTDSDKAFAALSYIGADPVVANVALAPVDLTVEPFGSFFRVALPGRIPVEGSIDTIINRLFRLLADWLVEEARGSPILHAAIATIEGRRFAFLGDKGFGKTTLMLGLIATGNCGRGRRTHRRDARRSPHKAAPAACQRDFPRTRSRSARCDTLIARPKPTGWATGSTPVRRHSGERSWEIAEGPIDHLVFVEPNFGGSSILSPLALDEAFARLMETTFMPSVQLGVAAVRLRKLCVEAGKWRLAGRRPRSGASALANCGETGYVDRIRRILGRDSRLGFTGTTDNDR